MTRWAALFRETNRTLSGDGAALFREAISANRHTGEHYRISRDGFRPDYRISRDGFYPDYRISRDGLPYFQAWFGNITWPCY